MKLLLNIIILSFIFSFSFAFKPDSLIKNGNKLYAKGLYELAIDAYEQVVDSGYQASELYYNLGNAYYKSNNIPYAILNFERAKLLDPFDDDIKHNLALANAYVVDKIDAIPEFFLKKWIRNCANITSSDSWAKFSVSAFVIFLLFFLGYLFFYRPGLKKLSFWLAILLFFVSLSTFYFSLKRKQILTLNNSAVIITPTLTVKSSPNEEGNDLFIIHEGTVVYIEDSINDWNQIKISDGNKGWIKKTYLVKI
jgi:tetratricopeptide (TPR) repeat protein